MIIIHNISEDTLGVSKYQVKVNKEVICEFEHDRTEGLGMCLLKASEAIEKEKWQKLHNLLSRLQDK